MDDKIDTGDWLILSYLPVTLFSLRMTHATSKGGKTLLVPTPYSFKMTMLDACFRVYEGEQAEIKARQLFELIKGCAIRFNPPSNCIVQNTFIKIRQEERDAPKGLYVPTIAYREFCFYNGNDMDVAISVKGISKEDVSLLKQIGSHINCMGKRGSFFQFKESKLYNGNLPADYTAPIDEGSINTENLWPQYMDDFGEALCKAKDGFDRISTYGAGDITLGKHRVLVKTLIPYYFSKSSKHFTQYKKPIR